MCCGALKKIETKTRKITNGYTIIIFITFLNRNDFLERKKSVKLNAGVYTDLIK